MRCYQVQELIGQGRYGRIYRGVGRHGPVAVKRTKQWREGRILYELRGHAHIVTLLDVFSDALILEYAEYGDLACVLRSTVFDEPAVKTLSQHLFSALSHCHSLKVIHRDVKLANLLYKQGLKLCDFGLATFQRRQLTLDVVSLRYRAPELLLGASTYDFAVDVWAAGCCIAEIARRRPFLNGRDQLAQIHHIGALLGPCPVSWPKSHLLKNAKAHDLFKDSACPLALDLLRSLLRYDPNKRATADKALQHDWFDSSPRPTPPCLMPTPTIRRVTIRLANTGGSSSPCITTAPHGRVLVYASNSSVPVADDPEGSPSSLGYASPSEDPPPIKRHCSHNNKFSGTSSTNTCLSCSCNPIISLSS